MILMISNSPSNPFFDAFCSAFCSHYRNTHRVSFPSVLDCPKAGDEVSPGLSTHECVEERKQDWLVNVHD